MKHFKWFLMVGSVLLAAYLYADTSTTRAGIQKPDQGSTGWGTKTNSNWDIVDSSFAVLGAANTFTGAQRMLSLNLDGGIGFYDLSFTKAATIQNLTTNKYQMTIGAQDGIFVNGNYFASAPGLNMFAGTGQTYGSFAVIGSSQDASVAYSGFAATGPISQSTLWTLPRGDGSSGQAMVTDGSGHLSFGQAASTSVFNSATLPQITVLNPNSAGIYHTSIGMGFNGTASYFLAQSNSSYLCSDLSTVCLTQPLSYGASSNGGTSNNWSIDKNGKMSVGLFTASKSTATVWGNLLIGSGYATITNAPLNGLRVQGSVIVDSSMTVTQGISVSTLTVATDMTASTATITHLVGTTTNDNATNGTYGEYISSISANSQNFPTSGNFGDIASIPLTAGDWDVSFAARITRNGASITLLEMGVGTASGNSSTGLVPGSNTYDSAGTASLADTVYTASVSGIRVSVSAPTTEYFKFFANYSVATPKIDGFRISARRVR